MSAALRIWHVFAVVTIIALLAWWWRDHNEATGDGNVYPARPIQVVVPYAAGGGSAAGGSASTSPSVTLVFSS